MALKRIGRHNLYERMWLIPESLDLLFAAALPAPCASSSEPGQPTAAEHLAASAQVAPAHPANAALASALGCRRGKAPGGPAGCKACSPGCRYPREGQPRARP